MKNILFLSLFLFCFCEKGRPIEDPSCIVNAKVLTINQNILHGEMIGSMLSSADGVLDNDVIKIGLEINIGNCKVLKDIKFSHAELAYFKDNITIPLQITVKCAFMDNCYLNVGLFQEGLITSNKATMVINTQLAEELVQNINEINKNEVKNDATR